MVTLDKSVKNQNLIRDIRDYAGRLFYIAIFTYMYLMLLIAAITAITVTYNWNKIKYIFIIVVIIAVCFLTAMIYHQSIITNRLMQYPTFIKRKQCLIWIWLFPVYGSKITLKNMLLTVSNESKTINTITSKPNPNLIKPVSENTKTFDLSPNENRFNLAGEKPIKPINELDKNNWLEKLKQYFSKVELIYTEQLGQQYLIGEYSPSNTLGEDYLVLNYNYIAGQEVYFDDLAIVSSKKYIRKFNFVLYYRINNEKKTGSNLVNILKYIFLHDSQSGKVQTKSSDYFWVIIKYIHKNNLCREYWL